LTDSSSAGAEDRIVPIALGTSWREKPVDAALLAAQAAKKFAGISRVARIDGLTEIGFPVFSVVRPLAKVAVTINSGKGTCESESRASGLFEAIEVACAELPVPARPFSVRELAEARTDHVPLSQLCSEPAEGPFPWSEAVDYETRSPVLVPQCAISMLPCDGPYVSDTTGLASGSSFHEALFHAVMEVLERHNYSLALVHRSGRTVDLAGIPDDFVAELRRTLRAGDLKVEAKDISEWTGIPTYYALIFSEIESDSHLVAGGLGTHLDPLIALRRALTESIQSRAVAIAGVREDITDAPRARGARFAELRRIYRYWYEETAEKASSPRAIPPVPFKDAIDAALELARRKDPGLGRLVYYVYPSPDGISVVRAILEGAEVFGLDRGRLGPRIRKHFASLPLPPQ
jgi:YcaO-like protein with predicted kinase domain